MSITYHAYAVWGFCLELRPATKNKTKYNEDTGEPYTVEEHAYDEGYIDNVKVMNSKDNEDAFYCGEKFEGMEIHESGYEERDKFLGVAAASVGEYDGRDHEEIPIDVPDAVSRFGKKIGVAPKLFLVMSCG